MGSVQGDTQETDGHENGMPIILFRREIPLRPRAMETTIISSASNNPIRYGNRTAFNSNILTKKQNTPNHPPFPTSPIHPISKIGPALADDPRTPTLKESALRAPTNN